MGSLSFEKAYQVVVCFASVVPKSLCQSVGAVTALARSSCGWCFGGHADFRVVLDQLSSNFFDDIFSYNPEHTHTHTHVYINLLKYQLHNFYNLVLNRPLWPSLICVILFWFMKKMPIQTHLVDFIIWVIPRSLKNIAVDDFEGSRAWWGDSDRLLYLIGTFGPGSFQKHPLLAFPSKRGQGLERWTSSWL